LVVTKMSVKEREVYKRYKIPNCNVLFKRKVNEFHFSKANSLEHERAKFEIGFEIFSNGGKFVMESERVLKVNGKRRIVDIVDLSGKEFEIETSLVRAKRFLGEENVIVIPIGWSTNDLAKWVELRNRR